MADTWFVVAWKRTGKDYLYKQLNGEVKFNWVVYSFRGENSCYLIQRTRVAFADTLKERVSAKYGIPLENLHNTTKDFSSNINGYNTYRELLIYEGYKLKINDPDKFIKDVKTKLESTSNPCLVTDMRFLPEYDFSNKWSNSTTVRLFRNEVPFPKLDMTETSLDHVLTDYLFVLDGEFELALKYFPQYSRYSRCNVI